MINTTCKICSKEIIKNERDFNKSKSGFHFCSRSCSAKYNNTITKTKYQQELQNSCNNPLLIKFRKENFCSYLCKIKFNMSKTIEKDYSNTSKRNIDTSIRSNARAYTKFFYPENCMLCGYDKHYEVCHIEPIANLKQDEPIFTVNKLSNLVHLCPNCHWELDKGGLEKTTIQTLVNDYIKENIQSLK